MVEVECRTCRSEPRCADKGSHHRRTAFAWAKDEPVEDCGSYVPRWSRGVAGVLDLPAPHRRMLAREQDNHVRRR